MLSFQVHSIKRTVSGLAPQKSFNGKRGLVISTCQVLTCSLHSRILCLTSDAVIAYHVKRIFGTVNKMKSDYKIIKEIVDVLMYILLTYSHIVILYLRYHSQPEVHLLMPSYWHLIHHNFTTYTDCPRSKSSDHIWTVV